MSRLRILHRRHRTAAAFAGIAVVAGAWGGQALPAAVVEDLRGHVAGVEVMDYVSAGRVINLGERDTLVLSYLKSCWRETITGGTVTVGDEQSTVRLGRVEREQVACGGARPAPGPRQATQSAATVFRSLRPASAPAAALPEATVYGLNPVFDLGDPGAAGDGRGASGALVIERLDRPGERVEVPLAGDALLRGRFLDLARTDVSLTAGAGYVARLGARELRFLVDGRAAPGATPLPGRLLQLP